MQMLALCRLGVYRGLIEVLNPPHRYLNQMVMIDAFKGGSIKLDSYNWPRGYFQRIDELCSMEIFVMIIQ